MKEQKVLIVHQKEQIGLMSLHQGQVELVDPEEMQAEAVGIVKE